MIGRLVRSADFERVLRTRTRVTSAHFAVHHLADFPSQSTGRGSMRQAAETLELSTGAVGARPQPVDDSGSGLGPRAAGSQLGTVWLGSVVPKRHAKRSVTRTLLKRQMRSAMASRSAMLASGLWVIRLRAPFDRSQFPSAASEALRRLARGELEQLLETATSAAVGRSGSLPAGR